MKIRNLPKTSRSMIGLLALASMPVLAASDTEQTNDEKKANKDATVLPEVAVSGQSEMPLFKPVQPVHHKVLEL